MHPCRACLAGAPDECCTCGDHEETCDECELPIDICACEEAAAYDEENPL